jgi:hypothetical protein
MEESRAAEVARVVECLLNKHEALSSNSSIAQKKKKRRNLENTVISEGSQTQKVAYDPIYEMSRLDIFIQIKMH